MRFALAWLVLTIAAAAACSAPPKHSDVEAVGSGANETCCCKSTPATSDDGKPVYESLGTMECSTKQGDCVDAVQCNGSAQ